MDLFQRKSEMAGGPSTMAGQGFNGCKHNGGTWMVHGMSTQRGYCNSSLETTSFMSFEVEKL